jgi:hypothetical protein
MSLRKPSRITPELVAARRAGARLSTGPRTPAGKQNSKMNALKHGLRSSPENHRLVMLALGEDPQEFDALRQELGTSYGPGDALWQHQMDDLALLYWRRGRLERAQNGLLRRALQAVEDGERRRRQEMAGVTFDSSQSLALGLYLSKPSEPGPRLRLLLSLLGVIRAQVQQRTFRARQRSEIQTLYGASVGWRQARLLELLRLFSKAFGPALEEPGPDIEGIRRQTFGPSESAGEPQYQELLGLLDEEIAGVQEQLEDEEKANEERVAIEREAALAPVGEVWNHLVRQEAALDRSIDRKVRILLAMRKEFSASNIPPPEEDEDMTSASRGDATQPDLVPEDPQPAESTEDTNLTERSLNVVENKGHAQEAGEGSSDVAEKSGTCELHWAMLLRTKGVKNNERTSFGAINDNLSSSDPAPSDPPDGPMPTKV